MSPGPDNNQQFRKKGKEMLRVRPDGNQQFQHGERHRHKAAIIVNDADIIFQDHA